MIYTVENTAAVGKYMNVFVNGIEQRDAFYADTDMGVVRKYKYPLRAADGDIEQEEVRGVVTVEPAASSST